MDMQDGSIFHDTDIGVNHGGRDDGDGPILTTAVGAIDKYEWNGEDITTGETNRGGTTDESGDDIGNLHELIIDYSISFCM